MKSYSSPLGRKLTPRFRDAVRGPEKYPDETREPGQMRGFSEEQLRFLAESLPQIAWTARADGYVDYMNGRWFEYTGLTEFETYGELKTAVHPDDLRRYQRCWEHAVKTQQPYEVEYRFLRASDGAYRWHLGRGLPVRDWEGRVIKWFGTCTDIHSQKEAEQEIRNLYERLETLVGERTAHLQQEIIEHQKTERKYVEYVQLLERTINTLPMAAVVVSSQGKILHANDSFQSLFAPKIDVASMPLVGRPCMEVFRNAQMHMPSSGWETLLTHLHENRLVHYELTVMDGRMFLFEYLPSISEAGGYLMLVRNVTQERRLDAVKMEFMSLASHQLRTPLTAIRWALGRLRRTCENHLFPAELELISKIQQSASTMAQTIRTMLSISRVEAGLQAVTVSSFSLPEFLEEIQSAFAEQCVQRQQTFSVACPTGLLISVDPIILREILENLVTNAIKYTPKSGAIHLRGSLSDDLIVIEVQDTGFGIPEHQQEKVFTKFFRGENVVKVDTEGTGLGLYLVSRLVEILKGTVSFVSKPGEGTTFVVRLPVRND